MGTNSNQSFSSRPRLRTTFSTAKFKTNGLSTKFLRLVNFVSVLHARLSRDKRTNDEKLTRALCPVYDITERRMIACSARDRKAGHGARKLVARSASEAMF